VKSSGQLFFTCDILYLCPSVFFMVFLAYNSCTGGYIVIFTYVLKIYLSWIYPFHHSLSSSSLRTISTGFILLFSYMATKYIYHIYPHSPFLCIYPLPLVPRKDLFFLPTLHFLKIRCVFMVLVLWVSIYRALIKLTLPPITYSFSVTMLP
jgi:hypothetical protein